jgi:hypothetical protein
MSRRILPQRREAETFDLDFGGLNKAHTITVGFYEDGSIGEVFISGGKSGEIVEAMARDAAVILSMALQYGADLVNVKNAITRDGQDDAQSIIGVVVDKLAESFLGAATEKSDDDDGRSTRVNQHDERSSEATDANPG